MRPNDRPQDSDSEGLMPHMPSASAGWVASIRTGCPLMGDTAQATTMAEACTVSAKLVPQCNLDGPVWLDQPGHQAQD